MTKQVIILSPYGVLNYEVGMRFFKNYFGTELIELHSPNQEFNKISMMKGLNGMFGLIQEKNKIKNELEKVGINYFIVVITPLKHDDYLVLKDMGVNLYLIKLDDQVMPDFIPKRYILDVKVPINIFNFVKKEQPYVPSAPSSASSQYYPMAPVYSVPSVGTVLSPYLPSAPSYVPTSVGNERPVYEPLKWEYPLNERRDYALTPISVPSRESCGDKRKFVGDEYHKYPPRDCDKTVHEYVKQKIEINDHRQILSTWIKTISIEGQEIEIRKIDGLWNGYFFSKPSYLFIKVLNEVVYLPRDVEVIRDGYKFNDKTKGREILMDKRLMLRWDGDYVYY